MTPNEHTLAYLVAARKLTNLIAAYALAGLLLAAVAGGVGLLSGAATALSATGLTLVLAASLAIARVYLDGRIVDTLRVLEQRMPLAHEAAGFRRRAGEGGWKHMGVEAMSLIAMCVFSTLRLVYMASTDYVARADGFDPTLGALNVGWVLATATAVVCARDAWVRVRNQLPVDRAAF